MARPPLVATALAPMLVACGQETSTAPAQPRPVRTVTIEKRQAGTPITLVGRIEAEDEVALAFRIAGRLLENNSKLGDRVTPGQLVARLESQNEIERAAKREAALVAAQAPADPSAQPFRTPGHLPRPGLDHAGQPRSGESSRCRPRRPMSTPPKRN